MADVQDHRSGARPQRVNGKLPIKPGSYLQVTALRHGPATWRPAVAALLPSAVGRARQQAEIADEAQTAGSAPQVAGTGDLPAGFGRQVNWTGEDDFAMVAIINTADDYGLCVSGVRVGDTYEHISVAGHASFSTSTQNNGIAGLIGVVGVGANLAAAYFGQPELVPFLNAATKYAQQQVPESEKPSKRRDGYGVEDNQSMARQEGGVIICEPMAQGIYHSGDDDKYWIKPGGTRDDNLLPGHITPGSAFSSSGGWGLASSTGTGIYSSAPGTLFPDNAGFYEVHFILKRGRRDTNTPIP